MSALLMKNLSEPLMSDTSWIFTIALILMFEINWFEVAVSSGGSRKWIKGGLISSSSSPSLHFLLSSTSSSSSPTSLIHGCSSCRGGWSPPSPPCRSAPGRTVGHASVARSTSWWLPLWQLLKWVNDRCELYCCSLNYVRAFRTMDRSWRVRVQSNVTKTGTCICMRPWMKNSTVSHGSNALTTFLYRL